MYSTTHCNMHALSAADQLQQLASQPNGQTRIDAEQKLQKQKQDLDRQLSQKAQHLLQMRLVSNISLIVSTSFITLLVLFESRSINWYGM